MDNNWLKKYWDKGIDLPLKTWRKVDRFILGDLNPALVWLEDSGPKYKNK